MRRLLPFVGFVLLLCGCGDDESATVRVFLVTDLVPGIEFLSATTVVEDATDIDDQAVLRFGDPVEDGVRIADLADVPFGARRLRVSLSDAAGSTIASTLVRVQVSGDQEVTVILTRDCGGVSCPDGSDPALEACFGGTCASPDCVTGEEESCPAGECSSGADCPAADACAAATCLRGLCLYRADHDGCGMGRYCSPAAGCTDLPFSTDGGFPPMDGGAGSDGGAGADGGGSTDGGGADTSVPTGDGGMDASMRVDAGPPSCTDGIPNGDEADTDCGGPCPACGDGLLCRGNADCMSNFCSGGRCMGCAVGSLCTTVDIPCKRSRLACAPGPVCEPAEARTMGIPCGGTGMCDAIGICDVPSSGSPILPGTTAENTGYSRALELQGDRLVVGAWNENSDGSVSGAAYIYERVAGSFTFRSRLAPTPLIVNARFGYDVDIDGDLIAVGSSYANVLTVQDGAIYIYERQPSGAWMFQRQVAQSTAADFESFGEFGSGVAVTGSTILVGARGHDDVATGSFGNAGSAFVVEDPGTGWAVVDELSRSAAMTGELWGEDMDADGDTVVIAASMNPATGGLPGGVRTAPGYLVVQERMGGVWSETAFLTSTRGVVDDRFGFDVEIEGTMIVAGAMFGGDLMGGERTGAAYVYEKIGGVWTFTQELLSPDPQGGARFGRGICTTGNHIVVGASHRDNDGETEAGAAYVFTRAMDGNWYAVARLSAPTPAANDGFGVSCGADGTTVVVGASSRDDVALNAGAVYVYDLSGL